MQIAISRVISSSEVDDRADSSEVHDWAPALGVLSEALHGCSYLPVVIIPEGPEIVLAGVAVKHVVTPLLL